MRIWLALAAFFSWSSTALAANYTVEKSGSEIGFTAEQAGESFQGTFPEYDAAISFDPKNPSDSLIAMDVHVGKIRVEGDDRQKEVAGPEWLDVTRFAQARFASSELEKQEDGSYIAEGQLTIRGVTRPIAVPFTLEPRGRDYYAKGKFTINRRDFFVGTGQWKEDTWVAYPVSIYFDLLCIQQSSTRSSHDHNQSIPHT